jgi:hypothetical protein
MCTRSSSSSRRFFPCVEFFPNQPPKRLKFLSPCRKQPLTINTACVDEQLLAVCKFASSYYGLSCGRQVSETVHAKWTGYGFLPPTKRRIQMSSYSSSTVYIVIGCSDLCHSLSHEVIRVDLKEYKAVEARLNDLRTDDLKAWPWS